MQGALVHAPAILLMLIGPLLSHLHGDICADETAPDSTQISFQEHTGIKQRPLWTEHSICCYVRG